MSRKDWITKEQHKRLIEIWESNPQLTYQEKTDLFNKEFDTFFHKRTLQQRYSQYKYGKEEGLKESASEIELEILAAKEARIKVEQKKTTLMKQELHKLSRNTALDEMLYEVVNKELNKPFKRVEHILKVHNETNKVIEYVITDLHHIGGEEYDQWTQSIFHRVILDYRDIINRKEKHVELRITFLGDDIEGEIRKTQMLVNKEHAIQQAIRVGNIYADNINVLNQIAGSEGVAVRVVYIDQSNHNEIRPYEVGRAELPNADYSQFIKFILETKLHKIIVLEKCVDGIAMVEEDVYFHGHQGWATKLEKLLLKFGNDKNFFQGHRHQFEIKDNWYTFPTCKKLIYQYEKDAGYNPKPEIVRLVKVNGKVKDIRRIECH